MSWEIKNVDKERGKQLGLEKVGWEFDKDDTWVTEKIAVVNRTKNAMISVSIQQQTKRKFRMDE